MSKAPLQKSQIAQKKEQRRKDAVPEEQLQIQRKWLVLPTGNHFKGADQSLFGGIYSS